MSKSLCKHPQIWATRGSPKSPRASFLKIKGAHDKGAQYPPQKKKKSFYRWQWHPRGSNSCRQLTAAHRQSAFYTESSAASSSTRTRRQTRQNRAARQQYRGRRRPRRSSPHHLRTSPTRPRPLLQCQAGLTPWHPQAMLHSTPQHQTGLTPWRPLPRPQLHRRHWSRRRRSLGRLR